ncbi:MAG: hypothetical protein HY741_01880 [Chloroflexi bacterium]|nr:hypothetical protein [Chloroflexota bacterium]
MLTVYVFSPVTTVLDSAWVLHTSMSILREGNIDLDEYQAIFSAPNDYHLERVGNHTYYYFPLGTSLLTTPMLAAADLAAGLARFDLGKYFLTHGPVAFDPWLPLNLMERVFASTFAALTVVVMYGIARHFLAVPRALVVVFIFAFCTSAWTTASRGLWAHGPSMLMLALAFYILLRAEAQPRWIPFAALPLALAYIIRPTNSISLVILSLYVLVRHRRAIIPYTLLGALILLPFFLYNSTVYQNWLPPYFHPQGLTITPAIMEPLAANLVSPSRGLLIFSPIVLLSIGGLVLALQDRSHRALALALAVILVLHSFIIASVNHWARGWVAGWAIGPRLYTDMLPYLIYFLIPVLAWLPALSKTWRVLAAAGLVVLATTSFAIHFHCATSMACMAWNYTPIDIDRAPQRIWDWSDPQFLRR